MPKLVLDPGAATQIPTPSPSPAAPSTVGISLAQARAELQANFSGRTDIEPERYNFWLNRAYIDLATSTQLDELKASLGFPTVEDQPLYLLPNIVVTTMTLTRVDDDDAIPLEKIDSQAYRRRVNRHHTLATRKPSAFFRSNRLVVLHPTPDDGYELLMEYRFEPDELTEDEHCPIFHSEWHEAWILLARKKMLSANREWEASIAAGNDFASHARVRRDREGDEDENRVVLSSVPRSEDDLRRRNRKPSYRDSLRDLT